MLRVPQNITAPSTITLILKAPTLGSDLRIITAGHLNVIRKDGTTTAWGLDIVSQTAYELVVQYRFTGGGEITGTGVYYLDPIFTVPGGNIAAQTFAMFVQPPGAFTPQVEESGWLATTGQIDGTNVSPEWVTVTHADSPFVAIPTSPWMKLDFRTGDIDITLWSGTNGNNAIMVDAYYACGNPGGLTVHAASGQGLPNGDGTFTGTITTADSGFQAQFKIDADGNWIIW